MSANDELRAHLIVLYEHARDALKLIDAGAVLAGDLVASDGSCLHPENKRTRYMGGYWQCECGEKGRDA
jgi:hypothetical protein